VLGRVKQGDVMRFLQLVYSVLQGGLVALVVIRSDPWRSVLQVSGEDSLGSIDHEERCVKASRRVLVLAIDDNA
jgi:hypothetical protein